MFRIKGLVRIKIGLGRVLVRGAQSADRDLLVDRGLVIGRSPGVTGKKCNTFSCCV